MAFDGSDILLFVNTGTESSPSYEAAAYQRSYSQESSRDMIETTVKQDDAKTYEYGELDESLTVEGLYAPSDAAFAALQDAKDNASTILVRRSEDGSEVEEATALVENISVDAPRNDVRTFSSDLQITGKWSTV